MTPAARIAEIDAEIARLEQERADLTAPQAGTHFPAVDARHVPGAFDGEGMYATLAEELPGEAVT